MADDSTASTEASATETHTEPQQAQPDIPTEVRAALKKANKEAETLRLKLKEYEDRDKTEQQRLEERAAAAERAAAERESQLLRYQVGTAAGLPADLIDRLRGDTIEDLTADAEKLLNLVPAPQTRTAGAIDQGPRSESTVALNSDALLESVKARLGIR